MDNIYILILIGVVFGAILLDSRRKRIAAEKKNALEEKKEEEEVRMARMKAELKRSRIVKEPARRDICYLCRYWDAGEYGRVNPPDECGSNECRRYPPHPDHEGNNIWPYTDALDWCGEMQGEEA